MGFKLLIIAGLAACSFVISVQDIRQRLVSAWAVIAYMLMCVVYAFVRGGITGLLENTLSVSIYFLLCCSALTLYYYIKEKKLRNIIDSKIGLADVLLILGIGATLELQ
ncbi:MAG: prepilin peptidase, partial [Bacteroidia bacterium]